MYVRNLSHLAYKDGVQVPGLSRVNGRDPYILYREGQARSGGCPNVDAPIFTWENPPAKKPPVSEAIDAVRYKA